MNTSNDDAGKKMLDEFQREKEAYLAKAEYIPLEQAMLEMFRRHDDFARQVNADHVQEKSRLLSVLENLTDVNRKPV